MEQATERSNTSGVSKMSHPQTTGDMAILVNDKRREDAGVESAYQDGQRARRAGFARMPQYPADHPWFYLAWLVGYDKATRLESDEEG